MNKGRSYINPNNPSPIHFIEHFSSCKQQLIQKETVALNRHITPQQINRIQKNVSKNKNGIYSFIYKTIDVKRQTINEIIIIILRIKYCVRMNYLEELIRLKMKYMKNRQPKYQEFKKNVQYFSLITQSPYLSRSISRSYQGELYPIIPPTRVQIAKKIIFLLKQQQNMLFIFNPTPQYLRNIQQSS
ncbi:hypothetical protein ABPG73_011631 [Tetrahymena malaccensis]